MAKSRTFDYAPDYAIEPGETLRDTIETLGLSQAEVARRADLSLKHVNQIINGAAPISQETALALARVTGVSARVWNNLESNYQQRRIELEEAEQLKDATAWLSMIPTRQLAARGLIDDSSDRSTLLQQVLAFFGVASIPAWQRVNISPQLVYLRQSGGGDTDRAALAAWLREGEIKARQASMSSFQESAFRDSLPAIRSATRQPRAAVNRATQLCAQAGLAFVVVEEYPGARVSGAARWLSPAKPMIQLSLRYRYDDHFWFSFFHEAGHILLHPKKRTYVDDLPGASNEPAPGEIERQANEFATRVLVPQSESHRLGEIKTLSDVISVAEQLDIAPGIIVGQLHHQGRPFSWGNKLRMRIQPAHFD